VHKGERGEGLRRSVLTSQFLTKNSRLGELNCNCMLLVILYDNEYCLPWIFVFHMRGIRGLGIWVLFYWCFI